MNADVCHFAVTVVEFELSRFIELERLDEMDNIWHTVFPRLLAVHCLQIDQLKDFCSLSENTLKWTKIAPTSCLMQN